MTTCSLYRLPRDDNERQLWINAIPYYNQKTVSADNFRVCRRHWPEDTEMVRVAGGSSRPTHPPSTFDFPKSCLPTPKPAPRKRKVEFSTQSWLDKNDIFKSFSEFNPTKELCTKYKNILISPFPEKKTYGFVCNNKECQTLITVLDKPTMLCPVTFEAYKKGVKVTVPQPILSPNNGFCRYSQFFEAVNYVVQWTLPEDSTLVKVANELEESQNNSIPVDTERSKKIKFLTRQLQLLVSHRFTVADYCFSVEHYPSCRYEQMREYLVLPHQRRIREIISNTDMQRVLKDLFVKLTNPQQRFCFFLVDEVKIRPSTAYSGGVLNGMARNDPSSKASSVLAIMAKFLHGGPSVMLKVVPVHKLTAEYQFCLVKETTGMVEAAGGLVIGSITDNHKINQKYCTLFNRKSLCEAVHPLNNERPWFLLFDTVHLLKCIRNNWISESSKMISFDGESVASFSDVQALYEEEKNNILKATRLTSTSVYPNRLQLQNVQHVLRVFNEKVVASLKIKNQLKTAAFINQVLQWWKLVNVKSKGEAKRFNDPARQVQQPTSVSIQQYTELFQRVESGHGKTRVKCLTHDTKKALVQTMQGLCAVCTYLFDAGFQYVLLGSIQSDRIEGEFSVYRQATGANGLMVAGDVLATFKKRLAQFSASFLDTIDTNKPPLQHVCDETTFEDACNVETACNEKLEPFEEYSVAFVAGWLENKCDLTFSDDDELLTTNVEFIEEVSRGGLTIPHVSTFQFVRGGLCYMKKSRFHACCRKRVISVLTLMNNFYNFGCYPSQFFHRLANVLLKGYHNLEKDKDQGGNLYQTAVKKARLA